MWCHHSVFTSYMQPDSVRNPKACDDGAVLQEELIIGHNDLTTQRVRVASMGSSGRLTKLESRPNRRQNSPLPEGVPGSRVAGYGHWPSGK